MTAIDDRRRQLLQGQATLNGIDFVEVIAAPDDGAPTQLHVTFVNTLAAVPAVTEVEVSGGERIQTLAVVSVEATDAPETVLVTLAGSGDLSPYRLRLVKGVADASPPAWADPILACATFGFNVDCDAGRACDDEPECGPAPLDEPQLDYLARDWESLRAVLLDRLSVLQPEWTERNPADVRVALVEWLAERADRSFYRQDAIATEAYLGTARRRISVRRHARLVDYAMSDGTNARAWVQLKVPDGVRLVAGGGIAVVPEGTRLLTGDVDAPTLIAADTPAELAALAGGALEFQTLDALDVVAGAHTSMAFYTWSGSRPCLAAGATVATLAGALPDLASGQVLLLIEARDPAGPRKAPEDADPTRRQPVRLTRASVSTDPLTGDAITEIEWHSGDALRFPLTIAGEVDTPAGGTAAYEDGAFALGNIVLADHGRRMPDETLGTVSASRRPSFRLAAGPVSQRPLRHDEATDRLVPFDPAGSADSAIGFVPDAVLPDATLTDARLTGGSGPWNVRRDLLASGSARDVVIEIDDDAVGRPRFGRPDDGLSVNGMPPDAGEIIKASYRVGNGTIGNVGRDAIRTVLDDGTIAASLRAVLAAPGASIANPLPARGGSEPETIEEVRQRAPFAFRRQERAVTADDYARRAERFDRAGLARVQRAVASIRWTGSWYTVVVAVDPVGGAAPSADFLAQLADYLDDYRMAGHDLQVVAAQYAPIEVGLSIEVEPDQRRDLVRAEVFEVLSDRRLSDGRLGLFHPDRLTFGTAVYLGPILAAAQDISGVARVAATRFSRYRLPGTDARATGRIEIGPREIAQLDNDPSRPERGRFHLDALEGGR